VKVWVLVYSAYGASKPAIKIYPEDAPPSTAAIVEWLSERPGLSLERAKAIAKEVAEAGESTSFAYDWAALSQEELHRHG
jgi:hypothetical protein